MTYLNDFLGDFAFLLRDILLLTDYINAFIV